MDYLVNFKKMLTVAVGLLFASCADAEYLYWQVSNKDTDSNVIDFSFNGAYILAENGSGESQRFELYSMGDWDYESLGDAPAAYLDMGGGIESTGEVYANLDDLGEGYSYFIELVNYDESSGTSTQVAKSQGVSYSDLSNYLTGNLGEVPGAAVPWHGTGFSGAVPEPTSGALLLLGAGLAAFKKRRNLKDLLKRKA